MPVIAVPDPRLPSESLQGASQVLKTCASSIPYHGGSRISGENHIMNSYRKTLEFRVPSRMGFVNITAQVQAALRESGIREGLCLVNAMHITASVFINDDEQGLLEDYSRWLEQLAPFDSGTERYHHNRTGEVNGTRTTRGRSWGVKLLSPSRRALWISDPGADLLREFDGRRAKRVLVKIIGE